MDTDNLNQPPQSPRSVPEWFSDTSVIPAPKPPTPKKSHKRLLIIIGIVVTLMAIVLTVIISSYKTTCLDSSDYRELTGIDLVDNPSPTDTFYADYVTFKDNSTDYDNSSDNSPHGDALIQRVAEFYKNHTDKPIVITVSGNYFTAEAEALAGQRISTIESDLLKAGVPAGVVAVESANYIEPEEGIYDGETIISITSSLTCR